jgi:hypothetical protein
LVRLAALETAVAATGARVEKRVEAEVPAAPESAAPATVVQASTSTAAAEADVQESSTTPTVDAQEATAVVSPEAKAADDDEEETNSEDMIAELLASRAVSKNPYLDDSDDD